MKVLFTTTCKPIPIFLGKYLSLDQTSYRFVVDQDLFSVFSSAHSYSLHFLAQNINVPSVVLEWPTLDDLTAELRSDSYDCVGISFRSLDTQRVLDMIDQIRTVAPHAKIILGGYGVLGLEDLEEEGIYLRDKVDYICRGEGVAFMRSLLGDDLERPKIAHLPVETATIPWLGLTEKMGYILSALGCEGQCEFCATSAYAGGRVIEVMTPPEIYESMKWYYSTHRDMGCVFLMDENLLIRKEKVNALGRLIRDDEPFGLSKMNYLGFGTCLALSRWEPEELLLNGVSEVWSGIESFYSYGHKKETDVHGLFRSLHEHGIQTQLSWIIGDDCQTRDNIGEDIRQFIELAPVTAQLSCLCLNRGTSLYRRLKQEGRTRLCDPEEGYLYGNSMDSLHFTHQERLDIIFNMYRRLYETHGPSLLRGTKVEMNGYRYCLYSKNPYLRGPKLKYFKRKVRTTIPFVKTAIVFAPNARVKKLMEDLEREYIELFGPLNKLQRIAADQVLALAEQEHERREAEGYVHSSIREIPLQRYEYPGSGVEELYKKEAAAAGM